MNLNKWLIEILNKDGKDVKTNDVSFDPEQFLGCTQIPILVIGTKLDMMDENYKNRISNRLTDSVADKCGADEILLNTHNVNSIAAGSTDSVKLSRFFDKVIERKFYPKDSSTNYDRRKIISSQY